MLSKTTSLTAFMASQISLLLFHFILASFFAFATTTLAKVPPNETFQFINQGEFGDYISEYDAYYRLIETNEFRFLALPFRLCFYNTTPGAHVFAIRAGLPRDESLMRWVWDANRDDPVRENATLTFGEDGNLVLADVDGRVAWQTNTANKGVTALRLLENGNLVLIDKNGKFVWQSFDHPVDTLLVGQSLRINGPNKLVSRTSDVDGSDGPYSMILDRNGLVMYLNNSGKLLPYGGWQTKDFGDIVTFNAQPEFENASAYELVLTSTRPQARQSISPAGNGRRLLQVRPIGGGGTTNLNKLNYNATISFLRLGSDGNLKAYTYFDQTDYLKWDETFAFFSRYFVRECALPSKCGTYGLCDKGSCVACPSPKGLLGWSESCQPPKPAPCRKGGATVNYYKVVGVEHFLNPYLNDGEGPLKVEQCRDKCSKDCKCVGFVYKEDTSRCLTVPVLATLIKDVNATSVGYIKYSK